MMLNFFSGRISTRFSFEKYSTFQRVSRKTISEQTICFFFSTHCGVHRWRCCQILSLVSKSCLYQPKWYKSIWTSFVLILHWFSAWYCTSAYGKCCSTYWYHFICTFHMAANSNSKSQFVFFFLWLSFSRCIYTIIHLSWLFRISVSYCNYEMKHEKGLRKNTPLSNLMKTISISLQSMAC